MHLPSALGFLANGTFLAIIAHGLIGISLIWDKILLNQPATKSLANYIFWLGAISIFGLILIPFGFKMPAWHLAGIAFLAGAVDLAASWFYYAALKAGEASESLAVTGGFAPLATALIAMPLLSKPLGGTSIIAFALMVLGGFVMFATEKFNWRRVLPSVLLSAALFGLANDLQKVVFNSTGFISGYVFFTIGTFVGSMCLLLRPTWRQQIRQQSHDAPPKSKFWYMVNRFIAGVGSFLTFLAINQTSPANVSAISGIRYAIIFVGAFAITKVKPEWMREDFRRGVLIGKSVATAVIIAGLVLVARGTGGGAGGAGASWRPSPSHFDARAMRPARAGEQVLGVHQGLGRAPAILQGGSSDVNYAASANGGSFFTGHEILLMNSLNLCRGLR